jgi:hypothetical protein
MQKYQVAIKNICKIQDEVDSFDISKNVSFKQKQEIRELVSPLAIVMSSPTLPIHYRVEKILQKVDEFAEDCPICFEKACFAVNSSTKRANLISCGHMMHASCIRQMKSVNQDDHNCKDPVWKDIFSTYTKKCPLCTTEFTWSRV